MTALVLAEYHKGLRSLPRPRVAFGVFVLMVKADAKTAAMVQADKNEASSTEYAVQRVQTKKNNVCLAKQESSASAFQQAAD